MKILSSKKDFRGLSFFAQRTGGKGAEFPPFLWVGDPNFGISDVLAEYPNKWNLVELSFTWVVGNLLVGEIAVEGETTGIEIPLRLRLSYKGARISPGQEERLGLLVFNEKKLTWEQIPSHRDPISQRLVAKINGPCKVAVGIIE